MGDRATIQLVAGEEFSPVIYLHWAGYRTMEILKQAAPLMRAGDISYAFARLVGVCHLETEPNQGLGLGVWNTDGVEDPDVGDNGHFQVDIRSGDVRHDGTVIGTLQLGRF